MLSIDLDRFKAINDQFGHPIGDVVLAEVGDRLRSIVGQPGWVARIGGDEFIAILVGTRLRDRAQDVADAIIARVAEPFVTERGVAHAGASVGVVLMPEDGNTTDQLRENVDLALYRAKHSGETSACFFNAQMDACAQDRREIQRDLRKAVRAGEIALAYQPLVSARTGQITSAEALARWSHPSRGPIRPDIFIPLAEECGLIDVLGEQLLRRACIDAATWPEQVRVSVNLSPLQFISDTLLKTVGDALASSGLAPDRLQLEVTEGLVIRDVERTFEQLEQLRALGIQILIDDFGVGYSSLSYFQRFPFDKVKIDKSFVDGIATSRAAKAIIQAVVGLGEQLGMAVVAEGVENRRADGNAGGARLYPPSRLSFQPAVAGRLAQDASARRWPERSLQECLCSLTPSNNYRRPEGPTTTPRPSVAMSRTLASVRMVRSSSFSVEAWSARRRWWFETRWRSRSAAMPVGSKVRANPEPPSRTRAPRRGATAVGKATQRYAPTGIERLADRHHLRADSGSDLLPRTIGGIGGRVQALGEGEAEPVT